MVEQHPLYETPDARIIRGPALPWGEATHDENNTIYQIYFRFTKNLHLNWNFLTAEHQPGGKYRFVQTKLDIR